MHDIVKPTIPNRVEDMIRPPAYCALCIHYNVQERRCAAFPDGIPREIYDGRIDHRRSYEGDNGLRFQAKQSGDEEYVDLTIENRNDRTLSFWELLKHQLSALRQKRN